VNVLKLTLLALAFISLHAHAKEDRNLAVTQVNNAVSDKRIALVIGNGAYANSPLKNPVNDAKDIAIKLRKLGFDVVERNNLQTKQIGGALREFRSKLSPGAVALVFYAGHGLQIKGINYLPAVDADINSEEDVPNQSLGVNQIMDVLDDARTRLNLVFLDACRNNPYASRSFRSADRGLARISAPSGTLISYATKPGSVAADGNGRNGLYTSKLLAQMDSNIQIELTLKRVVTEVKAASQGKQEPWMEGSIEGDFCFGGCAASGGNTQVASLVPMLAPVGGGLSLEDIKKQQETRGQWDKWQAGMQADFDKIVSLNAEPDLQITAWERFLSSYAQDNPLSGGDEELRAQAQGRKQQAEERKRYEQGERNKKVNPNDIPFEQMRNMVADYYNTRSEWVGTFTLDAVIRWRLEEIDSGRKRGHVEYRYVPVPGNRMGRKDTGVDQRTFDFVWTNGSWRVTSMGGHMSGRL